MELRILGCSGGMGVDLRTTTLLLDDDVLIDAGTGVGDLDISAMTHLRHVFLSHSHLDHIASLPLLVDTIFDQIKEPIVVHGQAETLKALQDHVFNNIIWPDFSRLPNPEHPVMCYEAMAPTDVYQLGDRSIEMITVKHSVPSVGYRVTTPTGVFAFSGDTSTNDNLWEVLNSGSKLDLLIVEAAFANKDKQLSQQAHHYCPETLAADIAKLKHQPEIYISHNKPGDEELIFSECEQAITTHTVKRLSGGAHFTI